MVASRQAKVQFYRGFGRQRRTGFGAVALNVGRNANPTLRKCVVLAAKEVGADLLELPVLEIAGVVGEIKISQKPQIVWDDKHLQDTWIMVTRSGIHC